MQTLKIMIGALSAADYHHRRQACLETWANVSDRDDVDVVFLVGKQDCGLPRREGPILYCPCPDDYDSLPQKTRWFCLWALVNCQFEYLFKCDDDTYVDIPRLLTCGVTADYAGYNIAGYASGGAGYLLSKNAAISVVGRLFEATGAEDRLVQCVLGQAGIPYTPDGRFHAYDNAWPTEHNSLITSHYVTPERMRSLHAERMHARASQEVLIPRVFHHIWLGSPLPDQFREYIDTWRKHHPHWEFKLWTDDNLFILTNQEQFDAASSRAQQSDIARYEILFRFGGVYLDTDFECNKCIDPLLLGLTGFAAEEDANVIATGVIGSQAGHPLLGQVIEAIPEWFARTRNPVESTGPVLFTHFARGRTDFKAFDRTVFYPVHYSGTRWTDPKHAYAVHHWAHSWKDS